jgi:hypothetical protein
MSHQHPARIYALLMYAFMIVYMINI